MKGLPDSNLTEAGNCAPAVAYESQPPKRGGGTIAHGPFVHLMTGVIVLVVLVMSLAIFKSWLTVREPTSAIVVQGDKTVDGTQIVVNNRDQSWTATLSAENNYVTPVLLQPGEYHLKVTWRNHVLIEQPFSVEHLQMVRFELPSVVQVTGPLSGEVEVKIEGEHGAAAAVALNAANHYHAAAYLTPGSYHAVATDRGRFVGSEEFVVERAKPTTLHLGQPALTDDQP
ncbi:MAG TPA: hypothetical protein VH370_19100 [Humisphaera sp.]|jgi:hypothetical protein|nr:hypothetical protein [Humisphaera sp.]